MLSNYPDVARQIGLDPAVMLARAGIHPSTLRDPENWVSGSRALELLRHSAMRSGRDDIGVLLGERRSFASLGPVSLLLRHEATLRDIIAATITYRRLINELFDATSRENAHGGIFEWNLIPGLASSEGMSLLATIAYRVLVQLSGVNWRPECIHLRHRAPKQVATFRRVFDCSLEFESSFDGMSFDARYLDYRNPHSDPELVAHARRLLNMLPTMREEETITERTRAAIAFLLSDGETDVESAAKSLGLSVRTLQRRLESEGSSYQQLLGDVRRDLAARYLSGSDRPISEVANATGFATASAFSRWFMAEFKIAPARWRRAVRRRTLTEATDQGSQMDLEISP